MERLVHHRWLLFGLMTLLALGLSPWTAKAVVPDTSLTLWFLEDDPQLVAYNDFADHFGNDEVILLHIHDERGIFQRPLLAKLLRLGERLEALDAVHRVYSVVSTVDIDVRDGALVAERLLPVPLPRDEGELRAAADRARGSITFRDRLISGDGREAMVWIEPEVMEDFDARRNEIVDEVAAVIDEVLGPETHHLAGIGVIYAALNTITQRDFSLFIGLGYVLMFAFLAWTMRSAWLVGAAMGVVTFGVLLSLGIYGLEGHRLNLLTIMLPTLIFVLGVADAVHFPAAFLHVARERRGELDREQIAAAALRRVLAPCVMTTLTTMAGFLSLLSAPIAIVRDLGIYAAVGIGWCLVASVVLMSIAYMRIRGDVRLPDLTRVRRLLRWVEATLDRRSRTWAVICAGLCLWGLYGAMHIEADTYTLGYFPDDHPVVQDHRAIVRQWGDYAPIEWLIRPAAGHRVDDAEILRATEAFVAKAVEDPLIRRGTSLATVFRRMERVYRGPETEPLALTRPVVEQLKLVLGRQEWDERQPEYEDNVYAPFMERDGSLGRMTLTGKMVSSREIGRGLARLQRLADEVFGDAARVEPAGYVPLYVSITDYVMSSQIRAFVVALFIIFTMMWIWLRSLRFAFISAIVNIFPIGVLLAVMVALGIDLDVASATIAAIVLGVAIDDTIHFLYQWRAAEQQGLEWREALHYTFEHSGVPAVITTGVLITGYPILMLAEVKTVFYFGLLTTVAAAAALFADLVMLPLLLRLWPHRRQKEM